MFSTCLRRIPYHALRRSRYAVNSILPSIQTVNINPTVSKTTIRQHRTLAPTLTRREQAYQEVDYEVPAGKESSAERELVMQIQGPHSARSKPKKAQILNSQLVREILEREDWSGWKGCTILDMNPGLGIFSKVLNEIVKPSKHILLEPIVGFNDILRERMIENKPKGNEECETVIVNLDAYEWTTYNKLISEKIFEPVSVPHDEGLNKNILFVGNLVMKGIDGDRFITQIIEAIGRRTWLHSYGRVRMLAWIPDSGKVRLIPRSLKDRSRMTVLTEMIAEVRELAGDQKYHDHHTSFGKEIMVARENLIKNLAELEELKRKRAANPELYSLPERPTPENEGEDGTEASNSRKYSEATLKQFAFDHKDKSEYLGKVMREELETMYKEPGHKPWTPELEHPPWVYDDPASPITRPPPPPVVPVRGSASGRKRKDGEKKEPVLRSKPKKLHQPLNRSLRRLPLPDEFVLSNGYDAWQLLEAHKHHKSLDDMLQKWDDEVKNLNTLPPPPGEEPSLSMRIADVRKQYLTAEQCEELGYGDRPNFQKSGIILEELVAKHGGDIEVGMAWLKALGISKRKRALIDSLEEELEGTKILQWYKQPNQPIATERADVHPMEPVALLDITPKELPDWLIGKELTSRERADRWETMLYMMRNIFVLKAQNIKEAVATLGPGVEEILDGVENVDGGKRKVRMTRAEVFLELAMRYEKWPFRDKLAVWEDLISAAEYEKGMAD